MPKKLTKKKKEEIGIAVKRVIDEYGETLRRLGSDDGDERTIYFVPVMQGGEVFWKKEMAEKFVEAYGFNCMPGVKLEIIKCNINFYE